MESIPPIHHFYTSCISYSVMHESRVTQTSWSIFYESCTSQWGVMYPLTQEITLKTFGSRDLSVFLIDLLSDGDSVYSAKTHLKFGHSRENLFDVYGYPVWKCVGNFGSRNSFKSDLLRSWISLRHVRVTSHAQILKHVLWVMYKLRVTHRSWHIFDESCTSWLADDSMSHVDLILNIF